MRKGVLILFSLLVLFGLNLILYGFNEDYRFFVKKLKYSDQVVDISDEIPLDDTVSFVEPEPTFVGSEPDSFDTSEPIKSIDLELTDREKRILSRFFSYDLQRVEIKQGLFGLTSEYPDDYFEYIGIDGDIILYLFPTREYFQILEIFEVLSFDLPYEINEVNNFGQSSFFINVSEAFDDNFVRLIVESENGVFGLKIKKDLYNDVKQVLKSL